MAAGSGCGCSCASAMNHNRGRCITPNLVWKDWLAFNKVSSSFSAKTNLELAADVEPADFLEYEGAIAAASRQRPPGEVSVVLRVGATQLVRCQARTVEGPEGTHQRLQVWPAGRHRSGAKTRLHQALPAGRAECSMRCLADSPEAGDVLGPAISAQVLIRRLFCLLYISVFGNAGGAVSQPTQHGDLQCNELPAVCVKHMEMHLPRKLAACTRRSSGSASSCKPPAAAAMMPSWLFDEELHPPVMTESDDAQLTSVCEDPENDLPESLCVDAQDPIADAQDPIAGQQASPMRDLQNQPWMLLWMMLSELFGERCSKQASSGRTEDPSAGLPCSYIFDTRCEHHRRRDAVRALHVAANVAADRETLSGPFERERDITLSQPHSG